MTEEQKTPSQQEPEQPEERAAFEGEQQKAGAAQAAKQAGAEEKAARLEQQLADAKDTLLRTAAEYDNFRKRSQKEKDAAFGNGVAFAVEKLLCILDTLELAANAGTSDEAYKKGVLMTLDQARTALQALGVEEIEAEGKPFDPQMHAAVMQQPAPEGTDSGIVLQVLQRGYSRDGKVIRHATVVVAE